MHVCTHAYGSQQKALSTFLQELSTLVFFDRVSHSLGILPPRLGCLTKKPQEPDNFYLTSARITGMRLCALLCWAQQSSEF